MPWENICSTAPAKTHRVQGGDAHEHVAHVADAGIADDVLEVVLGQRGDRAVDDVHRAEADEHRHPHLRALRSEQHAHLDDAEGTQLHQHTSVQHADPGRRRDMAVGRPGMERPQAGEHAEPQREEGEYPHLREAGYVLRPAAVGTVCRC